MFPCTVQCSSSVSDWSFGASLRNECPVGSGHSASPAAERGLCCCLAEFTWAKQMVVSSYLCSCTPPVQKAPFFSWKRLASDYGGRRVTLMTSVALQPTVRQKLIFKIRTMCWETVGRFPWALSSDKGLWDVLIPNNITYWIQKCKLQHTVHPRISMGLQAIIIFGWTLDLMVIGLILLQA